MATPRRTGLKTALDTPAKPCQLCDHIQNRPDQLQGKNTTKGQAAESRQQAETAVPQKKNRRAAGHDQDKDF